MDARPYIAIIDYQLGNLFSVKNACEACGVSATITSDGRTLDDAAAAILPGVGAFGDAMANLRRQDMIAPIEQFATSGKPLIGVCLGMQLFFSESEEFGRHRGLDLIPGSVKKFPPKDREGRPMRVPAVGWNTVAVADGDSHPRWRGSMLEQVPADEHMYFVHSYYVVPENPDDVLCTSSYAGLTYASGVKRGNVQAFQFHPEKSGEVGLAMYRSLISSLIKEK